MYKYSSSVDKNWYSQCDKMLQSLKDNMNIIYYGNKDHTSYVDTVQSIKDAWEVIKQDRFDMQHFFGKFAFKRKHLNYEVWQNNELILHVTYD